MDIQSKINECAADAKSISNMYAAVTDVLFEITDIPLEELKRFCRTTGRPCNHSEKSDRFATCVVKDKATVYLFSKTVKIVSPQYEEIN